MADTLEQRAATLGREMRGVADSFEVGELRIEATEQDLQRIPALIKAELRLVESRDARMRTELADLKTYIDDKFAAVLKAIAETFVERGGRA